MKISDYVESQIKGLWGTDFDGNGIPVIKTNNLTYEGNIDYSEICKRNITKEQAKGCYLRPGDLLIEKSGGTKTHSVGYVSYFEGDENKFVCNNFILALRLKNTINSKFLFYQIQFKYESNQFSDCFNKTTGIQNLKVKDYLAKEIKIYSPEEQEKIVKELDTVRLIINKNKQILEKYDILIKSRFIEMFGDPVKNPLGWEVRKLKETTDIITGNTPSRKDKENYGTFIEWIKTDNITDKTYITTAAEYLSEKGEKLGRTVEPGSILMACIAGSLRSIGRVALTDRKVAFNQQINAIVPKQYNILFLYVLFQNTQSYAQSTVNMALKGILSKGKLEELEYILPPIELQNDFATFVQQIDKSKFAVQKSLEKTEILYKSLMQTYFG